jgi:hypothetical protein
MLWAVTASCPSPQALIIGAAEEVGCCGEVCSVWGAADSVGAVVVFSGVVGALGATVGPLGDEEHPADAAAAPIITIVNSVALIAIS